MADYRKFLPEPPDECRDPGLFRLLNEFHYVRWHPDHTDRRDQLKQEIVQDAILRRAEVATSDPYERLRCYAGELLIWVRRNEAAPFTLKLLSDPNEEVRAGIAGILIHLGHERYIEPLVNLAENDSSPYVRGCAAFGLGGQDPLRAIPVLIRILDHDHQEHGTTGHTPSSYAARALDEMMETEWTEKRLAGSFRTLHPDGTNLQALREQALVFLEHCRAKRLME